MPISTEILFILKRRSETNKLIHSIIIGFNGQSDYITPNGEIKWGLLSLTIPGRVGYQCYQRFKRLISESGNILDIQELQKKVPSFEKYCQPALLPYQVQKLVAFIEDLLDQNKLVTAMEISKKAQQLYYEIDHLAAKAAINCLIDQGEAFQDETGQLLPGVDVLKADILKETNYMSHKIMNDYHVPSFSGSNAWISRFLAEHGYVYKKAHYKRRGEIEEKAVDLFLMLLSKAIETYGLRNVLNMDETQIHIDNSPSITIARRGQKEVIIEKKFNDSKAGTTYIGTISMDPDLRFPLYCIAKGKTRGCETKYHNISEVECHMDHSSSGWCTIDIMKHYLPWLSRKMEKQPFALVLDIYSTHIQQEVKDLAKSLKIELVFIPANGTGVYQPLDRKIFGIVKKKLSETKSFSDEQNVAKRSDLFGMTHQRVLHIWNNISDSAISSAWEIPGLPTHESDSSEKDPEYSVSHLEEETE